MVGRWHTHAAPAVGPATTVGDTDMGMRRTALSVLAIGLGVVAATVPIGAPTPPAGAQGTSVQVDTQGIEVNDLRISFLAAVSPTARGYFRAYPADEADPTATFLDYAKSQDITNTGLVPLSATGASHDVIDIQGYFGPRLLPT